MADWAASGDCMVGLRFGTSADHGRCFSMAFIAKARALAGSSCCFADLGRSWCWAGMDVPKCQCSVLRDHANKDPSETLTRCYYAVVHISTEGVRADSGRSCCVGGDCLLILVPVAGLALGLPQPRCQGEHRPRKEGWQLEKLVTRLTSAASGAPPFPSLHVPRLSTVSVWKTSFVNGFGLENSIIMPGRDDVQV